MAEKEITVLCYWNGCIKQGPDGVYYEGSTSKKISVKKRTDFSRFLDGVYLITGLDKQRSKLDIFGRFPVVVSPHRFRYPLLPVVSDSSLEKMLHVPSIHPSINTVEFYLEIKPTSENVTVPASRSSPLANLGSSSKRQKRTQQEVGNKDSGSDGRLSKVVRSGVSEPSLVSSLWLDDDTVRVGLCFKDRYKLKKAVDWWSIKRRRKCTLRETEKDVYTFECGRWKCKWSLWAARMEEHGLVEITKYTGPHTCHPYNGEHADYEEVFFDDIERGDEEFVAYEIERLVRVHPTLSFAELKKLWKEKFGYKLAVSDEEGEAQNTKRQMQDAKKKAIKGVFGGWDRSFRFVPKLMSALHSSNGLLVDWQFDYFPNPESASFRSVFWAFPQSIEGFQHCRPLILVDTKSLGKCNMKLMIASGVDAANKYFPLAFGVTKEVSTDSWRWFLSGIREKVTQRQGLCLISSPHPDIVSVINESGSQWKEPWAYHRFCVEHLCSQFNSVFGYGAYGVENLVRLAGSSSRKETFDSYMKAIEAKNPEARKWLDQFPPHQWTLAHDSGLRYGIIKINRKAMFAVCRGFSEVAMTGGLVLLFDELRDAFDKSFSCSHGSLNRGDVFTKVVMDKLEEFSIVPEKKNKYIMRKTVSTPIYVLTPLEGDAFQVSESSKKKEWIVQLNDSTCTCGKFQSKKYPCPHALAVCVKLKINPLQYVDDCYTLERNYKTYAATFSPVPELSAWPEASGVPALFPPPPPPKASEEEEEEEEEEEYWEEEEEQEEDEEEYCRRILSHAF